MINTCGHTMSHPFAAKEAAAALRKASSMTFKCAITWYGSSYEIREGAMLTAAPLAAAAITTAFAVYTRTNFNISLCSILLNALRICITMFNMSYTTYKLAVQDAVIAASDILEVISVIYQQTKRTHWCWYFSVKPINCSIACNSSLALPSNKMDASVASHCRTLHYSAAPPAAPKAIFFSLVYSLSTYNNLNKNI